jgi:hypothetical protein
MIKFTSVEDATTVEFEDSGIDDIVHRFVVFLQLQGYTGITIRDHLKERANLMDEDAIHYADVIKDEKDDDIVLSERDMDFPNNVRFNDDLQGNSFKPPF